MGSMARMVPLALLAWTLVAASLAVAAPTVSWSGSTKADGAVIPVWLGEQVCTPLTASLGGGATGSISIDAVTTPGNGYPSFTFPYADINFPPSGDFDEASGTSPFTQNYCFTPQEGEECAYTVCFQASAGALQTAVRCFQYQVRNPVLNFAVGTPSAVMSSSLSDEIYPDGGLTVSAWVYPSSAGKGSNMTVLWFGSDRNEGSASDAGGMDDGLHVRNALKWFEDADTGKGHFFYSDCYIGDVLSPDTFCSDKWHYVAITIQPDNSGYLYVDNKPIGPYMNNMHGTTIYSVTEFSTSSRPDNNADGDNKGTFTIGHGDDEPFVGKIDEVRVWNQVLNEDDHVANAYARTIPDNAMQGLRGWYGMRPGEAASTFNDLSSNNNDLSAAAPLPLPTASHAAIPSMVPCTLGIEHVVGPCEGGCMTEVYGWGFSDSLQLKCKFGPIETRAQFDSHNMVLCESPGRITPQYVDVLASNDGTNFTDFATVNKETTHLYMESALFLDGHASAGAEADSVCHDLPSRAVSFGGWFCPKCGPHVAAPPPSPPPPSPRPPPPPSPRPPPPPSPSPPPPVRSPPPPPEGGGR